MTDVVGKVDYFAILIGPPKHGKSSLAAELAELRLRQGRWVIAQDRNLEFDRLCAPYASGDAFIKAIADAGRDGRPVARGARFSASADVCLKVAVELGEKWNRGHAHTPQPICLVINETTSFEGSGATWVGVELARAVAERRHLGLELIYCMQHAAQLPASMFEYVTEVHMFRQTRRDRVASLESVLGQERGTLAGLLALPPHRYATWRPMAGVG